MRQIAVVTAMLLAFTACGDTAETTTTPVPRDDPDSVTTTNVDATGDTSETTVAPTTTSGSSVTVTVSPDSGPSGTTGTITVKGEPDQIVIVKVTQPTGFEYQLSGTTDANGDWSDGTANFTGRVGDVIDIKATVGPQQDSPSASTTFTITALPFITFLVIASVILDVSFHALFIGLLTQFILTVAFGSITIEGDAPFVSVSGDVDDDGNFTATGRGTVAGFSDIAVSMTGTVTPDGFEAEYSMGVEGGLPTGEPITYSIVGEPVADPLLDGISDIEAFYEAFNAAQAAGDGAAMAALLHPAVFDRYGSDQCDDYLAGVVNPDVVITPFDATDFGDWVWELDGAATTVADTFTVMVNLSIGDEDQGPLEVHVAYSDGELAWFTDCGDPIG